jgi:hypothetical protein
MKKYKAKLYYNMVDEVELEAEDEEQAREKAFSMGGEGKTHTFYDFMEVEEHE